jgi:uncharacterized membrane protein YeiH
MSMDIHKLIADLGIWSIGSFTIIDLIAASTNAFNGALLARRPDHYRHYTVVGILIMAVIGGIGGGVARDIVLNDVPAAFTNPWYLIFCTLMAVIALKLSYSTGQRFKIGLFRFMTAFSLPWYAIVGANKALEANLPIVAAIAIGVIGPTAGRYFIDIISGITPKHFVKGEWFVGTAILASVVYIILYKAHVSLYPATAITFFIAFGFRLAAQQFKWEEPEPWEPARTEPCAK